MDVASQIRAVDEGCLVRAMPELATLQVTGDERQSWLAGLLTCDVGSMKPGEARYGLSVNKNGRVQAEVWVVLTDDRILLGVDAKRADALLEAMDNYLIMEDAELERAPERRSWWLAHGPKAELVAKRAREEGASAGEGKLAELDTAAIVAAPNTSPAFAEALLDTPDAVLATPAGWKRIRIERMFPHFGEDYTEGCYPQEASLEGIAVSFNKGCYLGQEAVFMLEKRGHVSRRLVRLHLAQEAELARDSDIATPDGEVVGKITSSVATAGETYAMGLVRYKHTLSGTELRVGELPATVSCLSSREQPCE
jgi:folate-binding protein YgfZ